MVLFPVDHSDRKEIGRTGENVSGIALGSYGIRDYNSAYKAFMFALEHGIDNIDTAEIYDNGKAEEFVGRVVKDFGREAVFVTTKMHPSHLESPDKVLKAAKKALNRLKMKTVDLYLIHWPNPSLSIEQQVRNFEVLIDEGYTRYIGVSNFDRRQLEEAIHATRKADIVVDQVYYNVLHKDVERDLLPFCIENGVTIQAYTSIERGRVREHPVIREIAEKYRKTPIQVALNYLLSHPRVIAIVKSERIDHIEEIIGAFKWRMTIQDLERLEEI